ncbi:MAG: hypothetical protein RLZZ437_1978 [Pseudomonadota bacterium]|jgi:hypothetical protein
MQLHRHVASVGLVAWLTSTAAYALSADQLWQDWQANAAALGATLTSDPATPLAGALTLRNITVSAEGRTVLQLDQITLTERPEGTVEVTLPPTFPIRPAMIEDTTTDISVSQTGLIITVHEPAPNARLYEYMADSLNVTARVVAMIDPFDGGSKQPDTTDFSLASTGLSGSYSDTPGTNRSFAATFGAKTLAYELNMEGPFETRSTQSSSAQDTVITGNFVLPATFDLTTLENPAQMADALRDGLAATLEYSQGQGQSDQADTSEFLDMTVKTSAEGSTFRGRFDRSGIFVVATSLPISASITASELPFPQLDLTMGATAVEIQLPVLGPEVQDFRYMTKIENLAVNDEAWAALDPTGALQRTPIEVDFDVRGRTALDLFGMIQADQDGTIPPIPQIENADIVRLLISAAGAEVTGTGAFTFDNSLGYPTPRGTADFVVKGANKMIDALITLGVITADDAMGARMAMALFLDPTDEPDVMTSKIEVREDNGFYVNGQQMR